MTLSKFILSNMEGILQEWEKYARTVASAAGMDVKALRDHAQQILETIARDIAEGQSGKQQEAKSKGGGPPPEHTAAQEHAGGRHSDGFSLDEMVSEYRALRASVIRLWTRDMSSANRGALDDLTRFNEAIDQALTESIGRYSRQLDRSRQLFLGVLGHDLRSPVGAVMNSAQYLLQTDGLSAGQTKSVSMIQRSARRISQMVSDLLDVVRTRLGESLPISPTRADLTPICQQVIGESEAFHPEHTITLSAAERLEGTWDEARLSQMLSNLVENAIRHGAADRPVTVTASHDGEHVQISVHNEGSPIPEAAMRRIFEPLGRAADKASTAEKMSSLGLGLYIAREIVQAHHGTIEVASSEKKGTTFTVRLPEHTGR